MAEENPQVALPDAANMPNNDGNHPIVAQQMAQTPMVNIYPPNKFLMTPGNPTVQWRQWIKSFERYMLAIHADSLAPARKTAILLCCLGNEGERIYDTLSQDSVTAGENDDEYTVAIKMLQKRFQPTVHTVTERGRFSKRDQKPGESIDEYLSALRTLSVQCNFTDPDVVIRDKIFNGSCVPKIRERLLMQTPIPDLLQTMEIARQVEASIKETKSRKVESSEEAVHQIKYKRVKPKRNDHTEQEIRK